MRIEVIPQEPQPPVYLTQMMDNEPGLYIGRNQHIWVVDRDRKLCGYFSSTLKTFASIDDSWASFDFISEQIQLFKGDLVLRSIP